MKTTIALAVLIVVPTLALAQGTVVFESGTGLVTQWTSHCDSRLINVPTNGGYVQLIIGPAGYPLNPLGGYGGPLPGEMAPCFYPSYFSLGAFLAANPGWSASSPTLILPTAAGQFNGGVVTIYNIPEGSEVDYVVIGWTGPYATLDAALARGGFVGESAIARTATGDPRASPPGTPVSLSTTFPGMMLAPSLLDGLIFTYTTNNGTITITGSMGWCGMLGIPGTINGLPVTSIGDSAFAHYSLISVSIPDSVTSIGDSAFAGCAGLTAITVDARNPSYCSVDGVLFNKTQTMLIQCPAGQAGSYTVPDGVTNIGQSAFAFCGSLTSIAIPKSVTHIGPSACASCSNLTAITADAANSFYSSSMDGVLFDKTQTTLIQCPGGKAGNYTIPNSVTSIGSYAFYSCRSLTNVSMPSSVTGLGDYAFGNCSGLAGITFGKGLLSIGDYAFYYCTGLTSVTIPPVSQPSAAVLLGNAPA